MHNCSSCLRMWTLRWLRGNDHTPNLIKEFLPFLRGCYRFKDGQTLVVPHMLLACAPIEYDHLFRIVAVHRVGTKTHLNYYDERFQCWSNVEIEIEPVVTGDMSMLMYLIGRDYMLEKKSSPYHDILHKNTGKLLAPVARAPKEALKAMVQARWPNCKEMLAIAMYVNDHSVDVSDMLLLPETVEVQTSTGEAGSSSDLAGLDSLFGTNAGAKTKKRKTDAKKAAKKKWAWKSDPNDPAAKVGAINKALGPPEDELKKFRSALDLGGEDTEHSVSDKWTVVILPSIPPFGESDLEDAIGILLGARKLDTTITKFDDEILSHN